MKQSNESFFRFCGGKHFLIKKILPLMPSHKVYVEVFGGSAKLLFKKTPSDIEVYNDIDGNLVNLFEVVRNNFEEFMKRAEWLLYSRELNKKFQNLNVEDNVERAVRTWYIYQTSFSGTPWKRGWSHSKKINSPATFQRKLNYTLKKIHSRLQNVYVDHLDFRQCIKKWDSPETLFFMDPPYRKTFQANLYILSDEDYKDLAEICHKIQGRFIMTLNVDPFLQSLFKDFKITYETAPLNASNILQGRRRASYLHMIVMNYEVEEGEGVA